MSVRNDHGGYWENDEEFILPVARLIDQSPAGAPAVSRFFPESAATRRPEHRERRVKLLQFAWVAVMVSAVVAVLLAIIDPLFPGDRGSIEAAGAAAWAAIGTFVTTFGPVLHFFEIDLTVEPISGPLAILVGVVAMLAVYYAVGRVLSGLWSRWDERERQIALQPVPAWRSETPLAAQLGLCGGAALWLFTFAASGEWLLVLPSAGGDPRCVRDRRADRPRDDRATGAATDDADRGRGRGGRDGGRLGPGSGDGLDESRRRDGDGDGRAQRGRGSGRRVRSRASGLTSCRCGRTSRPAACSRRPA